MCLNCGCGQLDTRHKETDLVREDVRKAAQGQGSSIEETVANMERSLRDLRTAAATETGSRSGAGMTAR